MAVDRSTPGRLRARALGAVAVLSLALAAALPVSGADGPAPTVTSPAERLPSVPALEPAPSVARTDRFAAIRYDPVPGEVATNRRELARRVRHVADAGARYVVLPELAFIGPLGDTEGAIAEPRAEPLDGPTVTTFAALAGELGVWIGLSITEALEEDGYAVTSVLLDPTGARVSEVRKRVLRPNGEDGPATVGFARVLLDTVDDGGRRLGIVSGDDLQAGVPRLADRGADTILVTANFSPDDPIRWSELAPTLARRFGVHLVIANRLPGVGGIYPRDGVAVPFGDGAAAAEAVTAALEARDGWWIPASLGLPSVPVPSHRPFNPGVVELGRELFFDPGLSSTGEVSCATCHAPEQAFANGEDRGTGVHGRRTRRNVPSLLNVAYRTPLQWDGNPTTIEQQFKYPLSGFAELNRRSYRDLLDYLRSRPDYVEAFRRHMGVEPEALLREHVAEALASFMRTLISGDSDFDRYYFGGDPEALSPLARRGLELFTGKARCTDCHRIDRGYALFMDSRFHRLGIGWVPEKKVFVDPGVGVVSSNDYAGMFFTPSLRNVAETAPYMHDGSIATLPEAIRAHYRHPELDPTLVPVELEDGEIAALVELLAALSGRERYGPRGERLAVDAEEAGEVPSRARSRRLIGRGR